jgi:hypothetical protein
MTQIEKFRQSTVRVKLDLNGDEKLSCSCCGSFMEDVGEIWVFTDDTGQGDTCCLACANIDPNPEPFETDES